MCQIIQDSPTEEIFLCHLILLKLMGIFFLLQWAPFVLAQAQTTILTGVCEQLMKPTIFSSVSLQLDSWNILI